METAKCAGRFYVGSEVCLACGGSRVAHPESAAAALVPQLSVDAMAAKMAEYDENWTVSYGRGTKLWTIVIPWHDIKVHSKKLTETFELAEAALAQAREKGVK